MPRARGRPNIADLVEDLKLLRVSANEYRTADEVQDARDEIIEKLKEENGTLDTVCFTIHLLWLLAYSQKSTMSCRLSFPCARPCHAI